MLQRLLGWEFPYNVRLRGQEIFTAGDIRIVSGNDFRVEAKVKDSRWHEVEVEVDPRRNTEVEFYCDCPYFDQTGHCKHIWALILAAEKRNLVTALQPKQRTGRRHGQLGPVSVPPKRPAWKDAVVRAAGAKNGLPVIGLWPSDRVLYYLLDTQPSYDATSLLVAIATRERKKNGDWGKLKEFRVPRNLLDQVPDAQDREILSMLGGIPRFSYGYPINIELESVFHLLPPLPEYILPRVCGTGRCFYRPHTVEAQGESTPLQWDSREPWSFGLKVERAPAGWRLRGVFARDGEQIDVSEPMIVHENGILLIGDRVSLARYGVNFSWAQTLRANGPIEVPATDGEELVADLLTKVSPLHVDWPTELQVKVDRPAPRPHFRLSQGQRRGLQKPPYSGELLFQYDNLITPWENQDSGTYDAENSRYIARDPAAEKAALEALTSLRVRRIDPSGYARGRWEISPGTVARVVGALVREKWHVEVDGTAFREAFGFRAELRSGLDWFELDGGADFGGEEVRFPALLKAIQHGEQTVQLSDGTFGLIPAELFEKYSRLTQLGRIEDGKVRFSRAQTGLLDLLLAESPEVNVDEQFQRARSELRRFQKIEAASQPPGFAGQLRNYQCEGLAWLQFLQQFQLGGCLADDMGVGKTVQVLALLETRRRLRAEKGADIPPSLVVVPRSLVYNWKQEAEKFTPALRLLDHTGMERTRATGHFSDYDLILATYGTLRRDVVELREFRFDYAILDEAQAIKNASSESAKAARLLKADHRLVMSGTPIENHLGELWSLFEYLNPGMLGSAAVTASTKGMLRNPDPEVRLLLSRALRPYILRRTKDQVEKELPSKLEQTIHCELDANQRKLYNELRDHYRGVLLGRIETEGLAKSKMHVLEALLRLRQAACHPGLVDKSRGDDSSAKLETLLARLLEVTEEGHKALVFSQFTSFLAIARKQLEQEKIAYEYLDGQTRNRQACVERFQSDADCKVFLISLKAGGVGLNLTSADYVFLLDPWWNPAVEMQAIDRAHRIGQTRPVFAYRLIAKETVEEKVLELQSAKRGLAEAIISEDNRLIGDLTREDLELLLS